MICTSRALSLTTYCFSIPVWTRSRCTATNKTIDHYHKNHSLITSDRCFCSKIWWFLSLVAVFYSNIFYHLPIHNHYVIKHIWSEEFMVCKPRVERQIVLTRCNHGSKIVLDMVKLKTYLLELQKTGKIGAQYFRSKTEGKKQFKVFCILFKITVCGFGTIRQYLQFISKFVESLFECFITSKHSITDYNNFKKLKPNKKKFSIFNQTLV